MDCQARTFRQLFCHADLAGVLDQHQCRKRHGNPGADPGCFELDMETVPGMGGWMADSEQHMCTPCIVIWTPTYELAQVDASMPEFWS